VTLLNRPALNIAFSTDALKANLSRLEDEWENYQTSRDRDGIYSYLAAVFELVRWWKHEQKAIEYARRALSIQRRHPVPKIAEPFAAVIFCTADPEKADYRMRSKWSRVLRYAAVYKDLNEPLAEFIKRKGGVNKCATRYTRRLGRGRQSGSIRHNCCDPFRRTANHNRATASSGVWPVSFNSAPRLVPKSK
jgi:hypothetical protein